MSAQAKQEPERYVPPPPDYRKGEWIISGITHIGVRASDQAAVQLLVMVDSMTVRMPPLTPELTDRLAKILTEAAAVARTIAGPRPLP